MQNAWRKMFISQKLLSKSSLIRSFGQVSEIESQNAHYKFSSILLNKNVIPTIFYPKTSVQRRVFSSEPELIEPVVSSGLKNDFSSQSDLKHSEGQQGQAAFLSDYFSRKDWSSDQVKKEFEDLGVSLDSVTISLTLRKLEGSPESALRFFDAVSESEMGAGKVSSKAYNKMLEILGRKDHVKEFWGFVERMKEKGCGIRLKTYAIVSERFNKEEMVGDVAALKDLFMQTSGKSVDSNVRDKILSDQEIDAICYSKRLKYLQRHLEELLNCNYSSEDLVSRALEFTQNPMEALFFFLEFEKHASFKHSSGTYNEKVKILCKANSMDQLWITANEMKNAGFSMEVDTYLQLCKRRMVKEAVDLYEFMMDNQEKPLVQGWGFPLRNLVVSSNPDMDLFSRIVKAYKVSGNSITKSMFDSIVKSLISAGKLHEAGKFLRVMEEGDPSPNNTVRNEILIKLCKSGKLIEACGFLEEMEVSGFSPSLRSWTSLIESHCLSGEVDKSLPFLQKMVEHSSSSDCGVAVEVIVNGFSNNNRAKDAFIFLTEMIKDRDLRPWHSTYKIMIQKLLNQRMLKEALQVLPLMKSHGFPPFLDPFIDHISKSGSGDDAANFLKAMTVKKFASTSVFLRMFEAFFKAGRYFAAQDFLSKSPSYIRSHADVLDLFCSMKPDEAVA